METGSDKTAFVFQKSYYETLKCVPNDETFRACVDALCNYVFEGKEPDKGSDFVVDMFFNSTRPTIDAAAARYERCKANGRKGAEHGIKGGRPRKQENPKENPKGNPNKNPKDNPLNIYVDVDKDIDRDIDKEIDTNVSKKKIATRFIAPTIDEVKEYIQASCLAIDANTFVDYYTAKGWKVGTAPMKDWKAAARSWHRRETERRNEQPAHRSAIDYTQPQTQPAHYNVCGVDVNLGVGERMDAAGRRTYGSGAANIPMDAPPRPSERHQWNAINSQWILI